MGSHNPLQAESINWDISMRVMFWFIKSHLEAAYLLLSSKTVAFLLPVKVKQNFKPVKASDLYAMAVAVASLYGNGSGVLAEFPEIVFEIDELEPGLA